MRRFVMTAAALSLLAGSAAAQSLAEAARKEKERREKAQQEAGAAKVVTADELQAGSGQLANDTSIAPAAPAAPERGTRRVGVPGASGGAAGTTSSGSSGLPSAGAGEAAWRSGIAGLRANIARLEKEVATLDAKANMLAYGTATQGKPATWRDGNGSIQGGETARQKSMREGSNAAAQLQWEKERKQVLDQLERARTALTKTKKDPELFEESARRQGVQPGWLR